MPMNPEVKAKWLEPLRSGKYQQGTHGLKNGLGNNHAFCCLGVLCNISKLGFWDDVVYRTEKGCSVSWLPEPVTSWALIEESPEAGIGEIQRKLSQMNDGGSTFSEIADWIEANL